MDQQFNRSEKNLGTLLGMAVFVSVGVLFSQGLKPLVCEAQMQFVEFAKLSMIKEVSKETKSELCLNKVNVYFSEEIKGELSLCSVDSKVELNERPYAGAPLKGSKVYSGEFYLLFKGSKLNLGKMTFVDKMPHDGTLFVEQLNPDNNQDFIILFQYGSSNFEMTKFYGYDFTNEKLIQYNFKSKNGTVNNEIYIGPG